MLKSVRFGFMLLDFIQQFFFLNYSMRAEQFSSRFFFFAVICLFLKKGKDVMY